jgi:glycosyltransferase involved in cell wall biosynthesis
VNVGFHYHIEASFEPSGLVSLPSHLGMVVLGLAERLGSVTLFAHGHARSDIDDLELGPPEVRGVDIGPMRSHPARTFWPSPNIRQFRAQLHELDALVIRGPTPLLPHFVRASEGLPVIVQLVADYGDWRPRSVEPFWRNAGIAVWVRLYAWQQRRVLSSTLALVNNVELARRVEAGGGHPEVLFTSTVRQADLPGPSVPALRPDFDPRTPRLLYAGRIIREKGLFQTIDAVHLLRERGYSPSLRIVGWEDPKEPIIQLLREHAEELGLSRAVEFPGYRPAGSALTSIYRDADVFLLPSYLEGFPHSIIEAMAAGLPVVTTRVGGIPDWLRDGEDAILVEPSSAISLADGIERVLCDRQLRSRLAESSIRFAGDHTFEKALDLLAGRVRNWARGEFAAERRAI